MIVFRKAYGLEPYLKPIHFRYLGQLLLIMSLLWFYFTFAEYLTGYYGAEPEEMKVFLGQVLRSVLALFLGDGPVQFIYPTGLFGAAWPAHDRKSSRGLAVDYRRDVA